ncbi:hypothetical protein [Caldisphaera lagunensis]|uniref:hypothetical protein n=1 Tax=Caldisphaera lagunensis TaxID=200415 RepID=UPI0012F85ADE|nr:hypothetical protein [Caldisphaera lagunensis]
MKLKKQGTTVIISEELKEIIKGDVTPNQLEESLPFRMKRKHEISLTKLGT